MIEGEDLRYGNWVTIDNPNSWPEMKGIPVRVKCINHQPNLYFPKSYFSIEMDLAKSCYAQYNEFVFGIPLTEEILIKAGWIWNEDCKAFEKYPNGDARMFLQYKDVSSSFTMFNYVIKALIAERIFYVHQASKPLLRINKRRISNQFLENGNSISSVR